MVKFRGYLEDPDNTAIDFSYLVRLWPFVRPFRRGFALALGILIVSFGLEVLGPYLIRLTIDGPITSAVKSDGLTPDEMSGLVAEILLLGGGYLSVTVAAVALGAHAWKGGVGGAMPIKEAVDINVAASVDDLEHIEGALAVPMTPAEGGISPTPYVQLPVADGELDVAVLSLVLLTLTSCSDPGIIPRASNAYLASLPPVEDEVPRDSWLASKRPPQRVLVNGVHDTPMRFCSTVVDDDDDGIHPPTHPPTHRDLPDFQAAAVSALPLL